MPAKESVRRTQHSSRLTKPRRSRRAQRGFRISSASMEHGLSGAHFVTRLVYAQRRRGIGSIIRLMLRFKGTDVPPCTLHGQRLALPHCATGISIHRGVVIGDDVEIFPNVTIGRARPFDHPGGSAPCTLERFSMICAGAVIVTDDPLVVAEGSVVGANSVLTQSTGPWEIWAGAPARKVGARKRGR